LKNINHNILISNHFSDPSRTVDRDQQSQKKTCSRAVTWANFLQWSRWGNGKSDSKKISQKSFTICAV